MLEVGNFLMVYREWIVEDIIDEHGKNGSPVLLFLPGEIDNKRVYVKNVREGSHNHSYLRELLTQKHVSTIITNANNGMPLGENLEKRQLHTYLGSEEARAVWGDFMRHNWQEFYLGGGYIGHCFSTVLSYFTHHSAKKSIHIPWTFSGGGEIAKSIPAYAR